MLAGVSSTSRMTGLSASALDHFACSQFTPHSFAISSNCESALSNSNSLMAVLSASQSLFVTSARESALQGAKSLDSVTVARLQEHFAGVRVPLTPLCAFETPASSSAGPTRHPIMQ